MNKICREFFKFLLFIVLSLFVVFHFIDFGKSDSYKVLEVVYGDTFYIDLNNDGKKDENELVKLDLVKTFSDVQEQNSNYILKIYSITNSEAEYLGKLAKQYSSEKLKNQIVLVKNLKKGRKNFYATIYLNNKDFAETLLSEGLAYSYNPQYFDYYIKFENKNKILSNLKDFSPKISNNSNISIYFVEPKNTDLPSKSVETNAGKEILKAINNAKNSIHFALYGAENQEEIFSALNRAKARGVEVLGVFDSDISGSSYYNDFKKFSNSFDIVSDSKAPYMHNKFFIIDDEIVLTGSMNISSTGSGGYNTNTLLKINSSELAKIYEKEFAQMRLGKFQFDKEKIFKENISIQNAKIDVYFSPNANLEKKIISLINRAKSEILVSAFYFTNKNIASSLINAKNNGVKIFVIMDAVGASNPKSQHSALRNSGIKVKVENFGGKNHEKNILIDNKILITGSANFSYSGYNRNDENTLIITDSLIANSYRNHFFKVYNSIPDEYLTRTPKAEGKESINSCSDRIDNDFDGLVDFDEPACK